MTRSRRRPPELVLVNDVPYARKIQFDSPLEEAIWERTRLP